MENGFLFSFLNNSEISHILFNSSTYFLIFFYKKHFIP